MPKQKRHSGAKKRFKVTGTGKLLRRKAMNHYLGKKSAKRKRSFGRQHDVDPSDTREVKRLLGDLAERSRVVDGDVCEHLAVELDSGLAAAGDELVVREALSARGRVDANDPEPAHVALAPLAVAVRVDERVLDRLVRDLIPRVARADVALGCVENLLAALAGRHRALDAGH